MPPRAARIRSRAAAPPSGARTVGPRPGWQPPPALLGLGLGAVYALTAWLLSFFSSFGNSTGAPASFWPASGITVMALAWSPRRRWPWLLAGVGAAEFGFDLHNHLGIAVCLGWALANVVEPLASVLLLGRLRRPRPDLSSREDLFPFIACAVVAGPALGALVGAATGVATGMGPFGVSALRWFVGDSIGVLVVAPAVFFVLDRRPGTSGSSQPVLILVALLAAATGFGPLPHPDQVAVAFLVVPGLIWLAFRGGQRSAALGVFFSALVVDLSTAAGWGPFARGAGAFSGLLVAQVFLGTTAFSTFMVALLSGDLVRSDTVEGQLRDQAMHDALTGLANRRFLFEQYTANNAELSPDHLTAFLMIDLDGFKEINDTFGHAVGDAVLVEAARRLQAETRTCDLVVRLGGDEFLVMVKDPASPESVRALAGRLTARLDQPVTVDGRQVAVGASVGVTLGRPCDGDLDALLRAADEDLYAVKRERHSGRPAAPAPVQDPADSDLAADLARALERGELRLALQPEFSLSTGALYGFEALARWDHPRMGAIPPSRFIPVAEASGLIGPLGAWVLTEACLALRDWNQAHPQYPGLRVAVNVSHHQLNDPQLYDHVTAALAASGIAPHLLTLEVTESALMAGQPGMRSLLWRLKGLGVRLAMDDFGSGYSTLAYLMRLPLDLVKFDRCLVEGASASERTATLVSSMVSMMHDVGMAVLAEGLETDQQACFFTSIGCDLAQGYLLARPGSPAAFDGASELETRARSILTQSRARAMQAVPAATEGVAVVVDDDPAARRLTTYLLASLGPIRVLQAGDADEFDGILLAGGDPDLILLDLQLPGRSGRDVVRQLREHGCTVPVLALTAFPEQVDPGDVGPRGFTAVLAKPLDPEAFVAQVGPYLGSRRWLPFAEPDILASLPSPTPA